MRFPVPAYFSTAFNSSSGSDDTCSVFISHRFCAACSVFWSAIASVLHAWWQHLPIFSNTSTNYSFLNAVQIFWYSSLVSIPNSSLNLWYIGATRVPCNNKCNSFATCNWNTAPPVRREADVPPPVPQAAALVATGQSRADAGDASASNEDGPLEGRLVSKVNPLEFGSDTRKQPFPNHQKYSLFSRAAK